MKRMLLVAGLVAGALGAGTMAGTVGAGTARAQTTLSFSSWVPWGHPVITALYGRWIDEVEKATQGRVKFNRLPKPVASPRAHLDAVRTGQADAAFGVPAYSPKRFAAFQFTELPLLGDSAEVTSVALWRTHQRFFKDKTYFAGVQLIGLNTHGPGHLFTRGRAVLKPEDIKGLKIRTGGPIPRQIVEAWGGVAVRQPAPKVYELLSTGVVDGVTFPWESVPSFRITSQVPYATIVPGGLYSSSFYLIVGQKAWDGLSQRDKDAMAPLVGEQFARFAGKAWDALNAKGEATGKTAGIKVAEAPAPILAAIKVLMPKFEAEYAKGAKAAGIEDGAAVIAYFRQQVEALRGK